MAKNIYVKLMELREGYASIIKLIQEQNKSNTSTLELENKIYDIKQKLNNADVEKMLADLNQVKADNEQLIAKMKALTEKS